MTGELSFLLELLIQHKLPKVTQIAIKERVAAIESLIASKPLMIPQNRAPQPTQAPSMQASIEAMEAERNNLPPSAAISQPTVATTPAAAQALQKRQQAIMGALSESGGNFEKGRTSARKY